MNEEEIREAQKVIDVVRDGTGDKQLLKPTFPVASPKTVIQFWDGQRWRFCPKCQSLAFDFAEAYAQYRIQESQ